MRIAVLSDIHANYHALAAALSEVDAAGVDELWCLGDTVGYGPRPNECCAALRDRAALCLAGNHDLAALGRLPLDDFNGDAAAAVRWTKGELDGASRAFLASLEPAAERPGVELYHGSPLDPVWDYVLSEAAAYVSFEATRAPLVLVGHSHVALALSWDGAALAGGLAGAGAEVELPARRWLLNPGSVGQPRGGDPRASWLLIDLDAGRATFGRAAYPVERTQAELRERGLPEALAARLALGQ
ncbi:MAG TPA: metallophosphoesterase family protein [Gaiellaceae bacterium]|nr:metallophosphoesterase family protein [Gaiellaceae bacterium]